MDPAEALAQIPPETPRDVRRPHVEAQLIATIERLIASGLALSDISISRLAREAGIGRATFYLYFPDRQAFNLRLADYLREALAPALEQLWAAVTAGDWPSVDEASLMLLRTYRQHGALSQTVAEAAAVDVALATRLQEGIAGLIALTEEAIDAGKQANVIRADAPSAEVAAILVWTAERMCSQLAPTADDEGLDRLVFALRLLTRDTLIRS